MYEILSNNSPLNLLSPIYSHSALPKVISGLYTIMPKDNSNGLSQYTIAQGQLL